MDLMTLSSIFFFLDSKNIIDNKRLYNGCTTVMVIQNFQSTPNFLFHGNDSKMDIYGSNLFFVTKKCTEHVKIGIKNSSLKNYKMYRT